MFEYSQGEMMDVMEQEKLSMMHTLNGCTNPSLHSVSDMRGSKKEESNGKLKGEEEGEEEIAGSKMSPKIKRSKRNAEPAKQNLNRGHWSLEENKKYHWFLEIHFWHFVNRHLRRMDKIFKSMEIFIDTRQAEQCRSHHQKMQKKYHNFKIIIQNLRLQHYGTLRSDPVKADMISNGLALEVDAVVDQSDLQVSQQQMSKDKKASRRAVVQEEKEQVPLKGEKENEGEGEGQSQEQKCVEKSKVEQQDKQEVLDMLGDSQILRNFGQISAVREEGQMFGVFDHHDHHDI